MPKIIRNYIMYLVINSINYLSIISGQFVHCMWDKDTDKMIWWPPEVEDCTSKYHFKDLHQNKNFHWIFQSRSFKD